MIKCGKGLIKVSKVSNVLTMLEYLSSGKKYSIQELSDLLEVTPRMIRVYKEELEKAGIYVDSIKGPYGGYVLHQNIKVPERFITPKEVEIVNKELFNVLSRCQKEKRKCYIEYLSRRHSGVISKRIIHPYEMLLFGNEWGVAAYCESKGDIRHFYLNRIQFIKILDEFF